MLSEAVENSILFSDCDFTSAKWWNGITDKIVIYAPDDTVPAGITPYYVYVELSELGKNTFAMAIPDTLTDDWSDTVIFLNNAVGEDNNPFYHFVHDNELLELMIEHTICHEMGHVLKLAHTYDDLNPVFNHICEDTRTEYPLKNVAFLSVMNYGAIFDPDLQWLTTLKPSYHDKLTLISRWECHYDCEN